MLQTFKLFKLSRWPEPPPAIPESVRYLELVSCPGLASLESIGHLGHLQVLRLGMCPDLLHVAVSSFGKLEELSLVDLDVTALDDLDRAPRLRTIYLAGLTELERIGSSGRPQRQLRKLRVSRCPKLRDISGMASFVALEHLIFNQLSALDDLRPIANLMQLKELDINGCAMLLSVAPLIQIPSLRRVKVRRCPRIRDLALLSCRNDLHVEVSR